jgi:predicted transcriptional regulator
MENYDQLPGMAQVSVTISEETEKLLEEMAEVTGLTKSSLAAEILRQGLYREAANLNTVASFREKFAKEQAAPPSNTSGSKGRGKKGGEAK